MARMNNYKRRRKESTGSAWASVSKKAGKKSGTGRRSKNARGERS